MGKSLQKFLILRICLSGQMKRIVGNPKIEHRGQKLTQFFTRDQRRRSFFNQNSKVYHFKKMQKLEAIENQFRSTFRNPKLGLG